VLLLVVVVVVVVVVVEEEEEEEKYDLKAQTMHTAATTPSAVRTLANILWER